jgi:hypothetical protein
VWSCDLSFVLFARSLRPADLSALTHRLSKKKIQNSGTAGESAKSRVNFAWNRGKYPMFQGFPGRVNQQAAPLIAGWKLLDLAFQLPRFSLDTP